MNKLVCPICKNKKSQQEINTPRLKVFQCSSCKISFVPKNTMIDKPDKDYFDQYSEQKYISYYKSFRMKIFKQNWKIIKHLIPRGNAVDLGASYGWFIQCAPKSWSVIGIERSKKVSAEARAKGIPVLTGDENLLKKKRSQYDLITLHNVFEHLPNPLLSLRIFNKALKPRGLLVIAIPNKDGLINRLSRLASRFKIYSPIYTLFQAGSPSPHFFYYNTKAIESLLGLEGFKIKLLKNQAVIDLENFDKRLSLEKNTNIFIKQLTKLGVFLTYHMGRLLNMSDEIIIYAIKDK